MLIEKKGYSVLFDDKTGAAIRINQTKNKAVNWIAEGDEFHFLTPFTDGTQDKEILVDVKMNAQEGNKVQFVSLSERTVLDYTFGDDGFDVDVKLPIGCGPRSGVELDFNLLDLQTGTDIHSQCMPNVIYTSPDYEYAYLIFATSDERYAVVTLNDKFCAWRIKYSEAGHRMVGFQILNEADDVITEGEQKPLYRVENLHFSIFFCENKAECYEKIASKLGISIVTFEMSGGVAGTEIPLKVYGAANSAFIRHNGVVEPMKNMLSVKLATPGAYEIVTTSFAGREHSSKLLCVDSWENTYDKVNGFYKKYFQHECGAFYRAIWKETLSPKGGVTTEGTAFGDPFRHFSCRAGEFGGFCAWAMIKNCMMFGEKTELMESIKRYLYNWVMNYGHEDKPFLGTIYKKNYEFLGLENGEYHLYHEFNYAQHEIWYVEELIEYYTLTGDEYALEFATKECEHIVNRHMRPDGMLINQNEKGGPQKDYSTVAIPICALIRMANIHPDKEKANFFRDAAKRLADYICKRGLDFPTEGEPCTEDGSMACAAASLYWAYIHLEKKPEYLKVAQEIMEAHKVLELDGADYKMFRSTLRFWETQYETRDWGPSINAGHGWTGWTVEAKALYAFLTNNIEDLRDAYAGTISGLGKVDEAGGMTSCYTPDMIPGKPHKAGYYGYEDVPTIEFAEMPDARLSSTVLAMDYPRKSYSTSGNYFFVKSGEIWSHMSGVWTERGITMNGAFENGVFVSAAPKFDWILVSAIGENGLKIKAEGKFVLALGKTTEITVKGGKVTKISDDKFEIIPDDVIVEISAK